MNEHVEYLSQVMAAFGCRTQRELADLLGVGGRAPTNWRHRGMSAKARVRVYEEARRRGIELPSAPQCDAA